MKRLIKKTVATLILLTAASATVWADGDLQCPKIAAPCLTDTTTNGEQPASDNTFSGLEEMFTALFKNIDLIF